MTYHQPNGGKPRTAAAPRRRRLIWAPHHDRIAEPLDPGGYFPSDLSDAAGVSELFVIGVGGVVGEGEKVGVVGGAGPIAATA